MCKNLARKKRRIWAEKEYFRMFREKTVTTWQEVGENRYSKQEVENILEYCGKTVNRESIEILTGS